LNDFVEGTRGERKVVEGRSCLVLELNGTSVARKGGKLKGFDDEAKDLDGKVGEHCEKREQWRA
jgi:hypothetical protein